jgi:hypothetical protein
MTKILHQIVIITLWLCTFALVGVGIWGAAHHVNDVTSKYWWTSPVLIGLGAIPTLWIGYAVLHCIGKAADELRVGLQPILAPNEIAALIEQETGRMASFEEVAAVQQILQTQRQQHLMNGALIGGAVVLGVHLADKGLG